MDSLTLQVSMRVKSVRTPASQAARWQQGRWEAEFTRIHQASQVLLYPVRLA